MDAVVLLRKLKVEEVLEAAPFRNVHGVVKILVDEVVGSHCGNATPYTRNTRKVLNGYLKRQVKPHEEGERKPVHCDMLFGASLTAFVGRGRVFVAEMVYVIVGAKGRFDELVRVKKVFVKGPFKKARVQKIDNKSD